MAVLVSVTDDITVSDKAMNEMKYGTRCHCVLPLYLMDIRLWILTITLVLICISAAYAGSSNFIHPNPYRSGIDSLRFEIDDIRFSGNRFLLSSELESVVMSRRSSISFPHRTLNYYYDNFSRMKKRSSVWIFPPGMMSSIKSKLREMDEEIQFFNEKIAEADVFALEDLYQRNGFHNAEASFTFYPDTTDKINILEFNIVEGRQYYIDTVVYAGLDELPQDLSNKVVKETKVGRGDRFNEKTLSAEVSKIHRMLVDRGYYSVRYQRPEVIMDTLLHADSVYIKFETGPRIKFGRITFVDSLMGQSPVTKSMKKRMLAFDEGQWYSKTNINQSRVDLMGLGTFSAVELKPTLRAEGSDTLIDMEILTTYRKQKDIWGAPYFDRTLEKRNNVGIEATMLHRNVFNIAQSLSLFGRIELQDVSRSSENLLQSEFEFQIGANYAQPLLFSLGRSKFGLASQIVYKRSKINTDMKLQNSAFMIKLPISFPPWTFFNAGSIELLSEWQKPINDINDAMNKSLARIVGGDRIDSLRIIKAYEPYLPLENFYTTAGHSSLEPTALTLSGSLQGDKRNNYFTPTSGYFTVLSLEVAGLGLVGTADFIRSRLLYSNFIAINKGNVLAFRGSVGGILQHSDYIPMDRQFFAGGANSVRGWESRRLRYPQPNKSDYDDENFYFFQDFIGSRVIVELSLEWRWRLGRPAFLNKSMRDLAEMVIVTGFLDAGNTFHWLADDSYNYKWYEYISGLAGAAGIEIGIVTPVGPLRVDFGWPIRDPENGWFTKVSPMFHFGIGHAF